MFAVFRVLTLKLRLCGYYSKEDTPVPIPNTEVKLFSADGTWWATAWESKTQPRNLFFMFKIKNVDMNHVNFISTFFIFAYHMIKLDMKIYIQIKYKGIKYRK